ncbi:alpha/beta hydrolase [Massilia agri]|uniref:Lysophospholipase n=1 Tax=Massilia agri TaxID=1886785 RepID=A0ABT2AKB2_9BURK|nr:alpha/beta hydrolase [Massilia agri]MCS0596596.1 lysophospholipase [Massilia agri]
MAKAPSEETVDGKDGNQIFFRCWRPEGPPSALVVICHGVNSHSGQYDWTARQLVENGFVVYALDLRGRGKSSGERFFVGDVEDYVGDLATMIELAKTREPGLPVFLLGHSAGGVVSCVYTLEHQAEIDGLICESFAFRVPAPGVVLSVIKGLSHVAPHLRVLKLHNEDFSRDPEAVRALNADPLIADEVQPASTVAALVRADERLEKEFGRITLPVLIMHGTVDKATVPAGSEFFYQHAGSPDKTLRLYEGHYHDLFNDYGKEEVLLETTQWIRQHLPTSNRAGMGA